MINANLEQFLDDGWYSGATLYYKGFTYICEGWYKNADVNNPMEFFVYRYRSIIVEEKYTYAICKNNDGYGFEYLINNFFRDASEAKQYFLTAEIFDGKNFWEVEDELAWYEEIGSLDLSELTLEQKELLRKC